MLAFQFPTQVTADGDLSIPEQYRQSIPPGSLLQVVLLVDPPERLSPQSTNFADEGLSLEDYAAYLQQRPLPTTLITPASGLLGVHLDQPLDAAESNFDEAAWNQQWDQIEATLEKEEWVGEQIRLQEIERDLQ